MNKPCFIGTIFKSFFLVIFLMFIFACGEDDEEITSAAEYKISIVQPNEGGIIETADEKAAAQKLVYLVMKPNANFLVKKSSITVKTSKNVSINIGSTPNENIYTFVMPADNVTVTGSFGRTYEIKIGAMTGGTVQANTDRSPDDETITLTIKPNGRHEYIEDTLAVKKSGGTAVLLTNTAQLLVKTFIMPVDDVTVTAEFEMGDFDLSLIEDFESGNANQTFASYGNGYFTFASTVGGQPGTVVQPDVSAVFDGTDKTEGNKSGKMTYALNGAVGGQGGQPRYVRFGKNNYDPVDLSGFQNLVFQAKASAAGTYRIVLRATADGSDLPFAAFSVTTSWQEIIIPLSDIGTGSQINSIVYIAFEANSTNLSQSASGSLWIDEVKAE